MSGGYFDYTQYQLNQHKDTIEDIILKNNVVELDEYGSNKNTSFDDDIINEFKNAVNYLKLAQIYLHRIDWLLSGDDGEESFRSRLKLDLDELEG